MLVYSASSLVLVTFSLLEKIPGTHSLKEERFIWLTVSVGWLPCRTAWQKGLTDSRESAPGMAARSREKSRRRRETFPGHTSK